MVIIHKSVMSGCQYTTQYVTWCPSSSCISVSCIPNGEVCAQDRLLWRSMIHTGARTAETNRIEEAQKKRAAHKARLYSTTSTSAGPTYPCPEWGRMLQPELDWLATSAPTGSTKHDIIIIIEEVMVIIGNDGQTTCSELLQPGGYWSSSRSSSMYTSNHQVKCPST